MRPFEPFVRIEPSCEHRFPIWTNVYVDIGEDSKCGTPVPDFWSEPEEFPITSVLSAELSQWNSARLSAAPAALEWFERGADLADRVSAQIKAAQVVYAASAFVLGQFGLVVPNIIYRGGTEVYRGPLDELP